MRFFNTFKEKRVFPCTKAHNFRRTRFLRIIFSFNLKNAFFRAPRHTISGARVFAEPSAHSLHMSVPSGPVSLSATVSSSPMPSPVRQLSPRACTTTSIGVGETQPGNVHALWSMELSTERPGVSPCVCSAPLL
jgi:hypothetical protein